MSSPAHRLRVTYLVASLVRNMHPHLKRKIRASLEIIIGDPNSGKALREDLAGIRSMRVSRFRIIYRVRRRVIEVIAVGPRASIYEETLRLLKRETGTSGD